MKHIFFLFQFSIFFVVNISYAQGVAGLVSSAQWDALFPKRAGTFGVHPQGYTTDFYSYSHFIQAANEMSDYVATIQKKQGVWGELITITKKSTNVNYIYSDVDAWWYTNTTPITNIVVDFETFLNTNSAQNNKRELAAFLSNISKETTGGWELPVGGGTNGDYAQWGLYFVHEVGYNSSNSAGVYSIAHALYPPNPAKGYYGRGPIQLSWNYNYGQLSKFLYNDVSVLLDNPDLVQQDGVLALKSAIWFWMMPQCPKPSCHQAMHEEWIPQSGAYSATKMYKNGFAHTNNIINGGLECRSSSSAAFTQKVFLRSELYKYYLGILGFNSTQIAAENTGNYTTLCFESTSNAMEDYTNCDFITFPVSLISFEANSHEDYHFLEWKTAQESNNDYFDIERSNDGYSFSKIGSIKGAGTTTEMQTYTFKDYTRNKNMHYYRLKQVNLDGTFGYSSKIKVVNEFADMIDIQPNPCTDKLQIVHLPTEEKAHINLINATGIIVFNGNMEGNVLDLTDLKPGIYYLKIQTKNQLVIKKLVKI